MLNKNSSWWNYLSKPQKLLIQEAFYLLEESKKYTTNQIIDYSYLIFPLAKAYEGFLKQLFLDMGLIRKSHYHSDHFRIGKALSPNLAKKLGKNSIYGQLVSRGLKDLADKLWHCWKQGRNLVFHYFPHNYRALTRQEAAILMNELIEVMEEAVTKGGIIKNYQILYLGKSKNWSKPI